MVTWLQCMEIAHTISASILASQDHELMNLTLGQLSKIERIIENEVKEYFENTEDEGLQTRN